SAVSNIVRWDWLLDTSPPAAPAGVTALHHGNSIHVQWSANSEPDLAGYRVYRAAAAGGPYLVRSVGLLTDTQFDDADVGGGAKRAWYRVTAVDAGGNESAPSAAVAVISKSSVPAAQVQVEEGYPNPSTMSSAVHIPVVVAAGGVQSAHVEVLDS